MGVKHYDKVFKEQAVKLSWTTIILKQRNLGIPTLHAYKVRYHLQLIENTMTIEALKIAGIAKMPI